MGEVPLYTISQAAHERGGVRGKVCERTRKPGSAGRLRRDGGRALRCGSSCGGNLQ